MTRLLATVLLSAALAPRSADPATGGAVGGPSLRWVERAGRAAVEVTGLDAGQLDRLGRLDASDRRWPDILSVRVPRPDGQPEAAPIVGRREVVGPILRFTPRYPLLRGMQYTARFQYNADTSPILADPPIESAYAPETLRSGPAAEVVAVYPTTDRLPENQLKLYLHFSAPMSRGEAYRRVHLLDEGGRPVERPFLEIGEELWDPGGTRLTLLFDPGRIKRGLVPRKEEGPILEEGTSYTLVVDAGWPDAEGRPLRSEARKTFRAGPPDEVQPLPMRWTFDVPRPGTRDPLVVHFPEPLDRAMLRHAIGVEGAGAAVEGRGEVGAWETSWRFVPDRAWPEGPVALRVDTQLEDLAGNSIARPFEVDVIRDPASEAVPPRLTVPVPRPRPGVGR